jgi:putative addiction module killer protein
MLELRRFTRGSGEDVIGEWLRDLRDRRARARIESRLTLLSLGHFGDCKPVGEGVWELRVDIGPGYRVYYAMEGKSIVLLISGGDKRSQTRDIRRAVEMWYDHKKRNKT